MTRTVTIVGAGPGGLASAMLLARAGLRVRILERLETPGGRTSSLESGTGFRFDLGPTFFLYPRVLSDIFSACGYDLNNEVEMVKLDPQYRLIFGSGGDLLATPDLARMEDAVGCNERQWGRRHNAERSAEQNESAHACWSSSKDVCSTAPNTREIKGPFRHGPNGPRVLAPGGAGGVDLVGGGGGRGAHWT